MEPEFLQWLDDTYGITRGLMGLSLLDQQRALTRYVDPNGPYYQYWKSYVMTQEQVPAQPTQGQPQAERKQPKAGEAYVPTELPQAEQDFLNMLWNYLQEQEALGVPPEVTKAIYREHLMSLYPQGQPKQVSSLAEIPSNILVAGQYNTKIVDGQPVYEWAETVQPKQLTQLRLFNTVNNWVVRKGEAYQTALTKFEAGQADEATLRAYEEEQGKYEDYLTSVKQATEEAARKEEIYARSLPSYLGAEGYVPKTEKAKPQAPPIPPAEKVLEGRTGELPRAVREFARTSGVAEDEFARAFPGAREAWQQSLIPAPNEINPEESVARLERDLTGANERAAFLANLYPELVMKPGQTTNMVDELTGMPYTTTTQPQQVTGMPDYLSTAQQLAWAGLQAPAGIEKRLGEQEAQLMKAQAGMGEAGGPVEPKRQDPWEKYVQEYPFMGKWLEQSRYQRGLAARYQTPKVRWRL